MAAIGFQETLLNSCQATQQTSAYSKHPSTFPWRKLK